MMSSMGLGGEGAKGDMDFMPMMENVMKSLLSKDVLYPSLKEITSKVLAQHSHLFPPGSFLVYQSSYPLAVSSMAIRKQGKSIR